jgi:hypothetical protein
MLYKVTDRNPSLPSALTITIIDPSGSGELVLQSLPSEIINIDNYYPVNFLSYRDETGFHEFSRSDIISIQTEGMTINRQLDMSVLTDDEAIMAVHAEFLEHRKLGIERISPDDVEEMSIRGITP